MKTLLLTISLPLLSTFTIFAQRGADNKDRGNSEYAASADFAVKFAPTQMFSGQFNFSFETRVGTKSSFELSVGPTFGDFGFAPFDALQTNTTQSIQYLSGKLGYNASLGYRFYVFQPNQASLHGFYLSPVLKFNQLNLIYDMKEYSFSRYEDIRANLTSLTIQAGYQFIFSGGLVLDMYIGTGFGNKKNDVRGYMIQDPSIGNTEPDSYSYTKSKLYAAMTTGVRLGFGTNYKTNK